MTSSIPSRAVVVAIDGATPSKTALAFALEEGVLRNATVVAVTTWTFGTTLKDAEGGATYEGLEQEAASQLASAVDQALAKADAHPVVVQRAIHGPSGPTLVECAADAALLVVGSGRKGILTRTLLGSTSEYCARHSTVPIVVVPD